MNPKSVSLLRARRSPAHPHVHCQLLLNPSACQRSRSTAPGSPIRPPLSLCHPTARPCRGARPAARSFSVFFTRSHYSTRITAHARAAGHAAAALHPVPTERTAAGAPTSARTTTRLRTASVSLLNHASPPNPLLIEPKIRFPATSFSRPSSCALPAPAELECVPAQPQHSPRLPHPPAPVPVPPTPPPL